MVAIRGVRSATGISYVKARNTGKQPPMDETAPRTKNHTARISIMLKLRNPASHRWFPTLNIYENHPGNFRNTDVPSEETLV